MPSRFDKIRAFTRKDDRYVIVWIDAKGVEQEKIFDDMYKAKSFYVKKDKEGLKPKFKKANNRLQKYGL